MPEGGMAGGAPVVPSADEPPITEPQVPQGFMPPMGMGQPDPNQSTTKPRQMPGDSGGDEGGGPTDGPPEDDEESGDPSQPVPPALAKRQHAATIVGMMRTARKENPGLSQREAYRLAKAALDIYPIVVQADWDGLDFGNRGRVPDGPWAAKMQSTNIPGGVGPGKGMVPAPEDGEDGEGMTPAASPGLPAHGPSGQAPTGLPQMTMQPPKSKKKKAFDKTLDVAELALKVAPMLAVKKP